MIEPMRRKVWLILPGVFLSITLVAVLLTPDPSGHGTHRALGLPPCLFFYFTGLLCPSCGLTTSFTYLAHLEWLQAFKAHPLGPILFFILAYLAFLSFLEYWGRPTPLRKFLLGKYNRWIYTASAVFIITWGGRLALTHL